MDIAAEYKMTEIGVIPADWEILQFKDVFTFYPTNTYARDFMMDVDGEVHNVHYGDILVKYGSILNLKKVLVPYLEPSRTKFAERALAKDGDIIIADTAEDETAGKLLEVFGIGNKKVVSGLHTMLCRPKDGLFVPKFLGYFMNGSIYHKQLLPLMVGTKVSSISKSAIVDTYITVPPKDIQQKIVDSLQSIDNLIELIKTEITKKIQVKDGAMQDLLTGKTRLAGFSGEWCEVKLGDILTVKSGYPFKSETYSAFGDYKIITISNVKNGKLDMSEYNKLTTCPIDLQNHHKLKIGDIIVSMTGNVGRVCIVDTEKCLLNQRVGLLSFDKLYQLDKGFIYNALNSREFETYLIKKGQGAAQANIGNKDIESYSMYIPKDVDEQVAIASILYDLDAEITALDAERGKYALIKQGMMQKLLTGQIR